MFGLQVKKLLLLSALVCFAPLSRATTYYACTGTVTGGSCSDSNDGTAKTVGSGHGPWLHLPGMFNCSSVCNSTTINAGDSIILRGGDSWHWNNSSPSSGAYTGGGTWNWTWAGSATNCNFDAGAGAIVKTSCIYIGGGDATWFSGGSWTRPIFTMDNPLSTSVVTSCTYDTALGTQHNGINIKGDNVGNLYVIYDNLDLQGSCGNADGVNWFVPFGTMVDLSNDYIHGWTLASGPGIIIDQVESIGPPQGSAGYIKFENSIWDGTDSTYGTTSDSDSGSVAAVCADIENSVFRRVINVCASTAGASGSFPGVWLVANNLFDNLYNGGPLTNAWGPLTVTNTVSSGGTATYTYTGSPSGNAIVGVGQGVSVAGTTNGSGAFNVNNQRITAIGTQTFSIALAGTHSSQAESGNACSGGSSSNPCTPEGNHGNLIETGTASRDIQFYNNIISNGDLGIYFAWEPVNGGNIYDVNNVFFNLLNPGNCMLTAGGTGGMRNHLYLINTTIDTNSSAMTGCQIGGGGQTTSNSTLVFQNDHLIGLASSSVSNLVGVSATISDLGNEVYQTESAANTQGYSASNQYQPPTSGCTSSSVCATFHAGANLSSTCSTYNNCNGSNGGQTSTAGTGILSGFLVPSPPSRGTTWDAGSWQFNGGMVATPSICIGIFCTGGAFSSPQTITMADTTPSAVICYTVDGSTPTASAGSCTHGTTYSTSFSQSITGPGVTVQAIGTLSGSPNSSITSNTYTLLSVGNGVTGGTSIIGGGILVK